MTVTRAEAKKLDKFYTKAELAKQLYSTMLNVLDLTGDEYFLEPSAGAGSFSKLIKNGEAYDIKPETEGVIEADFLELELTKTDYRTVGNPPFGNRSLLAIEFFNKCAKHSKSVAFVVPITFMKWSIQSNLDKNFALVYSEALEEESFTFMDNPYEVRCCFQIWVRKDLMTDKMVDLRIQSRPPISHSDFKIWQHNATEGSRPYVDEPWEIATWRQGYKEYNKIFTRADYEWLKEQVYTTNLQFFYIQPLTEESRRIIGKMDFDNLAKRNMSTPGFGKGDFVAYYEEMKLKERA